MKTSDPASLQNLNDIVLPATVNWWPLAPGWYIVIGLLLVALAWFSYRSLHSWIKNRYRRAALCELQKLEDRIRHPEERDASLRKIPVLLKRTALAVYPRGQVASLSGDDWFHFLNSTVKTPPFNESSANTFSMISYSTGELSSVDSRATAALVDASRSWLKHHEPHARPKSGGET